MIHLEECLEVGLFLLLLLPFTCQNYRQCAILPGRCLLLDIQREETIKNQLKGEDSFKKMLGGIILSCILSEGCFLSPVA